MQIIILIYKIFYVLGHIGSNRFPMIVSILVRLQF